MTDHLKSVTWKNIGFINVLFPVSVANAVIEVQTLRVLLLDLCHTEVC